MEKNEVFQFQPRLRVLGFYICLAATFLVDCDARITILDRLFMSHKTEILELKNHIDIDDTSSSNSDPYLSSPISLPPFDSLSPYPSTEPNPPYCIYPPPFTPIGGPPSSPTWPGPSPETPPNPPVITPSPPEAIIPTPTEPVLSPPASTIPSPTEPVTSPPSPTEPVLGPPSTIPTPTEPALSPPPSTVPTPAEPILGPPPYFEPSPPGYTVPSPPTYTIPSPPAFTIPSPPYYFPSPRFLPPIVYPPPTVPPPPYRAPATAMWCVAKASVPGPIIQEAMNYACVSGADCAQIQPSGLCFEPNTLIAHASYAFNSYWQRTKVAGGTCDFGGTALLVTVDPSYDGCHFMYG